MVTKSEQGGPPLEIEAKFNVLDEATFRRLQAIRTLGGFTVQAGASRRVFDSYRDTAARDLHAAGYAFRVRDLGDRLIATLKGLGSAKNGVHQRVEYEAQIAEDAHPKTWPPSPLRTLVMELLQGRPLTDLFVLEQARSVSQLLDGKRSIADLSLDRVRVSTGERSLSWLELEVELAGDGSLRELRHISANLRNGWALTPQSLSKFERGLALLDKEEKG